MNQMTIQFDANLSQLHKHYFEDTQATQAAEFLDMTSETNLAHVLESHWLAEPSPTAIDQRSAIDDLLAFYAMLEVAFVAGCIRSPLPANIVEPAKRNLSRPSLARYYTHYYPLSLVQLFALRLDGLALYAAQEPAYEAFVQFLHVTERCSGEPVTSFLWLLDGGETGDGFVIKDLIKLVASGEELVRSLVTIPARQTGLDRSARGLLLFIKFCREMDRILGGVNGNPLLQSAFWHYHAYWFRQLGVQVAGVLETVTETYRGFIEDPSNPHEEQLVVATHADMDETHRAIRRLVSAIYSAELDRRLLTSEVVKRATTRPDAVPEGQVTGGAMEVERQRTQHTLDRSVKRPGQTAGTPRVVTINIPVDKIRDVIGPGGKMIRSIVEQTGVKIDIEDDGRVILMSADEGAVQAAVSMIHQVMGVEVNATYLGKIQKVEDWGAFVQILPGTDGLLHISEIGSHRVKNATDDVKEGEQIPVKVMAIDAAGRILLSNKAVEEKSRAEKSQRIVANQTGGDSSSERVTDRRKK
jgi:predicted RNA-binding protein with RPS1 domain